MKVECNVEFEDLDAEIWRGKVRVDDGKDEMVFAFEASEGGGGEITVTAMNAAADSAGKLTRHGRWPEGVASICGAAINATMFLFGDYL